MLEVDYEKGLINNSGEYYIYYPGFHAVAIKPDNNEKYKVYEFTNDDSVKIKLSTTIDQNKSLQNDSNISPLSTGVHYKVLLGVPDANYTDSCIPTAIGNIIGYWDTHGYPNLIISPKSITNAINEINSNLISECGNNTSNSAIPDATQNYCRSTSRYPARFTVTNLWNPTFGTYMSQITYNRPTLVGFASNGPYGGAHMTTGVGYYYDDAFPNEKYIYVHDAWPSTSIDYMVLWGVTMILLQKLFHNRLKFVIME